MKKQTEMKKKKVVKSTDDVSSKKRTGKGSPKHSGDPRPKPRQSEKDDAKKSRRRTSAEHILVADREGGGGGHSGTHPVRRSISDSDLEKELTGPIADPLNKEMERWQKGTDRIQAVIK